MTTEENLKCSELLTLVIDGQATKEQEKELMMHVTKCAKCKEEFELKTSIITSLRTRLHKLNSPRELSSSIHSKIVELAS